MSPRPPHQATRRWLTSAITRPPDDVPQTTMLHCRGHAFSREHVTLQGQWGFSMSATPTGRLRVHLRGRKVRQCSTERHYGHVHYSTITLTQKRPNISFHLSLALSISSFLPSLSQQRGSRCRRYEGPSEAGAVYVAEEEGGREDSLALWTLNRDLLKPLLQYAGAARPFPVFGITRH